jgi:hypothetical protein
MMEYRLGMKSDTNLDEHHVEPMTSPSVFYACLVMTNTDTSSASWHLQWPITQLDHWGMEPQIHESRLYSRTIFVSLQLIW